MTPTLFSYVESGDLVGQSEKPISLKLQNTTVTLNSVWTVWVEYFLSKKITCFNVDNVRISFLAAHNQRKVLCILVSKLANFLLMSPKFLFWRKNLCIVRTLNLNFKVILLFDGAVLTGKRSLDEFILKQCVNFYIFRLFTFQVVPLSCAYLSWI